MNNKLLARLFAVVMAVALLGTVALAANPAYDKASGEITTEAGNFGSDAYKTFLAFYANEATAETPATADDVVALVAGKYTAETFPAKVAIDTTKATKDYIIVQYSGSNGNPTRLAIDVRDKDVTTVLDVLDELVIGETTYKGVAVAEASFECRAGSTVEDFGIHFTKDGSTGDGAKISAKGLGKTLISGEGAVAFKAAILGVPDGTTLVAKSYIEYK